MSYRYTTAGSWTPVLQLGGASTGVTYTGSRAGNYYVSGRVVVAQTRFALSSKGSSTGNMTITGLPYAAHNTTNQIFSGYFYLGASAPTVGGVSGNYYVPYTQINPNSSVINVMVYGTGVSSTNILDSNILNNSLFKSTYQYLT